MPSSGAQAPDVLLVSLGSTSGLESADQQLREMLTAAGARVDLARSQAPRALRTMALTDLAWARAARRAASEALHRRPRAVIYSSTTAAMLWPAPGAIRFDALAAGNRPGRHGLWQRPLERWRLRQAPLLLPWSQGALAEGEVPREDALVLPVAVEGSGPTHGEREIAAITYGANPSKKGLDRVLQAWLAVRGELGGGELFVAGLGQSELDRLMSGRSQEGVRALGMLPRERYRELLRQARVFVCAPRREDYGLAQLEALADGCMLVSTPAPGPYAALPIARALDARLVGEDLAAGLRAALAQPLPGYAQRAREALAPYSPAAVQRTASAALARLLGQRA